jgi:signal peptidase II
MKKNIIIISTLVFFIDQLVKLIVSLNLNLNSSINIISDFFKITYLTNTGAAWSIFNNHSYLLIFISLAVFIFLIYYSHYFIMNKHNTIAFGLVFGGLLGNLFDRIFHGYVIDYLDFKLINYNYPVFNLADTALVIGIVMLIVAIVKGEDKNEFSGK